MSLSDWEDGNISDRQKEEKEKKRKGKRTGGPRKLSPVQFFFVMVGAIVLTGGGYYGYNKTGDLEKIKAQVIKLWEDHVPGQKPKKESPALIADTSSTIKSASSTQQTRQAPTVPYKPDVQMIAQGLMEEALSRQEIDLDGTYPEGIRLSMVYDANGELLDYVIEQSSGSAPFDAAVIEAIKEVQKIVLAINESEKVFVTLVPSHRLLASAKTKSIFEESEEAQDKPQPRKGYWRGLQ